MVGAEQDAAAQPLRSLLFAPGNRPRMLEKVGAFGADAVIVDLEDAVPLDAKETTRAAVRDALERYRWPRAYVRVNALTALTSYSRPLGLADISEVACQWLAGVVVPKVESVADVQAADAALAEAERRTAAPEGTFDLIPLVETALGVWRTADIAGSCPRVRRVAFGGGDFTTDIGVAWTAEGSEYFVARSLVVLMSRAARREAPLDTVFPDIADLAGLERDARQARALGFGGKCCIHPSQVDVVRRVFTPSADEVEQARRFADAFDAAVRAGNASVMVDGKLVDYANAERYRRVVLGYRG